MESRRDRLKQAAALVEGVSEELDTRTEDCSRCGKPSYPNFDEWKFYQQLDGIIDKLIRISTQIPEAQQTQLPYDSSTNNSGGTPRKDQHAHDRNRR